MMKRLSLASLALIAFGCHHAAPSEPLDPARAIHSEKVISVMDPTKDPTGENSIPIGQSIDVVLPEYQGTSGWKVSKGDDALGAPTEGLIDLWGGPNVPGHRFSWRTKDDPALVGDHVVTFSIDSDPPQTFTATIHIVLSNK